MVEGSKNNNNPEGFERPLDKALFDTNLLRKYPSLNSLFDEIHGCWMELSDSLEYERTLTEEADEEERNKLQNTILDLINELLLNFEDSIKAAAALMNKLKENGKKIDVEFTNALVSTLFRAIIEIRRRFKNTEMDDEFNGIVNAIFHINLKEEEYESEIIYLLDRIMTAMVKGARPTESAGLSAKTQEKLNTALRNFLKSIPPSRRIIIDEHGKDIKETESNVDQPIVHLAAKLEEEDDEDNEITQVHELPVVDRKSQLDLDGRSSVVIDDESGDAPPFARTESAVAKLSEILKQGEEEEARQYEKPRSTSQDYKGGTLQPAAYRAKQAAGEDLLADEEIEEEAIPPSTELPEIDLKAAHEKSPGVREPRDSEPEFDDEIEEEETPDSESGTDAGLRTNPQWLRTQIMEQPEQEKEQLASIFDDSVSEYRLPIEESDPPPRPESEQVMALGLMSSRQEKPKPELLKPLESELETLKPAVPSERAEVAVQKKFIPVPRKVSRREVISHEAPFVTAEKLISQAPQVEPQVEPQPMPHEIQSEPPTSGIRKSHEGEGQRSLEPTVQKPQVRVEPEKSKTGKVDGIRKKSRNMVWTAIGGAVLAAASYMGVKAMNDFSGETDTTSRTTASSFTTSSATEKKATVEQKIEKQAPVETSREQSPFKKIDTSHPDFQQLLDKYPQSMAVFKADLKYIADNTNVELTGEETLEEAKIKSLESFIDTGIKIFNHTKDHGLSSFTVKALTAYKYGLDHWKESGSGLESLGRQLTVLANGMANTVTVEAVQKVAKYQISKDSLAFKNAKINYSKHAPAFWEVFESTVDDIQNTPLNAETRDGRKEQFFSRYYQIASNYTNKYGSGPVDVMHQIMFIDEAGYNHQILNVIKYQVATAQDDTQKDPGQNNKHGCRNTEKESKYAQNNAQNSDDAFELNAAVDEYLQSAVSKIDASINDSPEIEVTEVKMDNSEFDTENWKESWGEKEHTDEILRSALAGVNEAVKKDAANESPEIEVAELDAAELELEEYDVDLSDLEEPEKPVQKKKGLFARAASFLKNKLAA